jgi:hypothetical protein
MGLTLITDTDYPGKHTYSVSSMTRSGTTVTVNTSATNSLKVGQTVTIAGANETDYNGDHTIATLVDGDTFTFEIATTPTTPATGTITAYGGEETVPGVVYLDGYFFVMTTKAVIYNSALGDGSDWGALDFITAEIEPGAGKALAKTGAYVVALKEWSIEYLYDAANPTGSPLSPVQNGFRLIGCASGESVTNLDGTLFWVSQTKERGRSVHLAVGLELQQISTPDVERVINTSDLSEVYSYGIKIAGHAFYVLTMTDIDITLVYDLISKEWTQWTSLTANAPISVSSITRTDQIATVTTAVAHGRSDGDPVLIAGANQSEYNGRVNVTVVDATHFTYPVEGSPASPATGTITCTTYTESYFKYTHYVYCNGRDLVLHETDGHLYEILDTEASDAANPIDLRIRTAKLDGDTTDKKASGKVEVIANKVDSTALVRWSDDDYNTFTTYRPVDLNAKRSQLRRCGDFRRRAFELRHTGDQAVQLAALELEITGGR